MNIKNTVIAGVLALGVGVTSLTVFAATKYDSPREALSAITGKSMEEIHQLRYEEGLSDVELFETDEQYEEFKNEVLELRKERIQNRVEDGRLSQERANEMINEMEENEDLYYGHHYGPRDGFRQDGNCHGDGEGFRGENRDANGQRNYPGHMGSGRGHRR